MLKEIIIPKGLQDKINEESLKITGYGIVSREDNYRKDYQLMKNNNSLVSRVFLNVSKEYLEERGLEDNDKIVFVEYTFNNIRMIDAFKRNGESN
jgi:hypothetical protein